MMVHLLDYIAVDYSMAVQGGEVVSDAEYAEMQEFSSSLLSLGVVEQGPLNDRIVSLQNLIEQKSDADTIASLAYSIKNEIISRFSLKTAPERWPIINSGKALFALHCASCHGAVGKGDGPLGKGLEPAPTNFHDPDKANGLSPFQAYNTIHLGVSNTGMRAFEELNDEEVWDLSFYILSLPFQEGSGQLKPERVNPESSIGLEELASLNNEELRQLIGTHYTAERTLSMLRLYPREAAKKDQNDYIAKAISLIEGAVTSYRLGDKKDARKKALAAYLEGIEPIEIQLSAKDAPFVASMEVQLSSLRSAIEKGAPIEEVETHANASIAMIKDAQMILDEKTFSGWLSFFLSLSIILREGLEAFLVVITMLGIVRAIKIPRAKIWIHSGWAAAVLLGFLLWWVAGRFFTFSGAQREVMEGFIALFAVAVLLYMGFWMHSKSEAGKWQAYVKGKIQNLSKTGNMMGLAGLAFIVVFREAFESVLFLSALSLEVGEANNTAFVGGILVAFILLIGISVLLLRYSKKLPISQLFKYSSILISILAVVLVGKGIHALQEAGYIGMSTMPFRIRFDYLGIYPTWESTISQIVIVILILILWTLGNKPAKVSKPVPSS